jgi:hypothetical protein
VSLPAFGLARLQTSSFQHPVTVKTVGHSVGAIIFGIFLYLLLRDRAALRA